MYGKTTRSRIGSSGRTSGIMGSPFRPPSFVVTPDTVSRAPKNQPRDRYFFWADARASFAALGLSDSLRLDQCDGSRRHRPDSAESIDRDVAHVAGHDHRARRAGSAPVPAASGGSARSPLLVATQMRPLPSRARPARRQLGRSRAAASSARRSAPAPRTSPPRPRRRCRARSRARTRWPGRRSRSRSAAALPASG